MSNERWGFDGILWHKLPFMDPRDTACGGRMPAVYGERSTPDERLCPACPPPPASAGLRFQTAREWVEEYDKRMAEKDGCWTPSPPTRRQAVADQWRHTGPPVTLARWPSDPCWVPVADGTGCPCTTPDPDSTSPCALLFDGTQCWLPSNTHDVYPTWVGHPYVPTRCRCGHPLAAG